MYAINDRVVGIITDRMKARLRHLRDGRFGSGQAMARAMERSDAYVSQVLGGARGWDWLQGLEASCEKAGIDLDELVRPDDEYLPGWWDLDEDDREAVRALVVAITESGDEGRDLIVDYVLAAAARARARKRSASIG